MGTFSDLAHKYFESGLHVIPVHGKIPCEGIELAQIYKHGVSDELIDKWCEKYPDAGIALICGHWSGVIGFDIDVVEAEEIEKFTNLLPPSPCSKVGKKGITLFYNYTNHATIKRYQEWDLLSDGCYTVIPPSQHSHGLTYQWTALDLLACFDELPTLGSIDEIKKISTSVNKDVSGGRNNFYVRQIGLWIAQCVSFEDQVKKLIRIDRGMPKPLFNDPGEPMKFDNDYFANAVNFVSNVWATVAHRNPRDLKDLLKASNKEHESLNDGFYLEIPSKNGASRWIPDTVGLADYAGDEWGLKANDGFTYAFNGKFYETLTDKEFKRKVKEVLNPSHYSTKHIDDFCKETVISNAIRLSDIPKPKGYVNFANGILDVLSKELLPHSSEFFFKYVLDYAYDQKATCPKWREVVETVTQNDKQLMLLLQEIFGYMFADHCKAEKFFLFSGTGSNGKSTVLNVVKKLLGKQNVVSINLKDLSRQFARVNLDGALANLCGESPDSGDPDLIKTLASGESILVSQKNKPEYFIEPTAKHIFNCNEVPYFKDTTHGLRRRMVIVPFDAVINKPDVFIHEKLNAEIPGIFNWALEGYRRLSEANFKFTTVDRVTQASAEYEAETDSVVSFWNDKVTFCNGEKGDDEFSPVAELYAYYRAYCHEAGLKTLNKNNFSKRFARQHSAEWHRILPGVEMPKMRKDYARGYRRVKLRVILS